MRISRNEDAEAYDPERDRQKMNCVERYRQDKLMIRRLLEGCALLGSVPDHSLPVQDEITATLRTMIMTKEKPSTWFIFVTQIFIDINNIMQEQSSLGLQDLQSIGRLAWDRMRKKRKFVGILQSTTGKQPYWSECFMK